MRETKPIPNGGGAEETARGKENTMEDIMTDKQFDKILKMVSMILDGCNDLDEAKEKVSQLIETEKKEKSAE